MNQSSAQLLRTCFDGYQLVERIGAGGMGTVYKAQHQGRLVAVKIARGHVAQSPVLRQRFEHECRVACRFQHPHLVTALSHGVTGGMPYLVMEYVPGQPLSKVVKDRGRLPECEALAIIAQVADALTFLHRFQLVHRDVKPENILVTAGGRAKLVDLGLIKDLDSESLLTKSSTGLGTFEYAAPEQYEDAKNADPRCDVYSLAVTLYLAVTGAYPFGSGGHMTVLRRKLTNAFDPPRALNPSISEACENAICKALQSDRHDRPATIAEFMKLLQAPGAGGAAPSAKSTIDQDAASPDERRTSVRYLIELASSCAPVTQHAKQIWEATALDVSVQGVCLRVARRFEVGTLLRFTLQTLPDDVAAMHLVRVRWVKEQAPELWLLGCDLAKPITHHDLEIICTEGMPKTQAS